MTVSAVLLWDYSSITQSGWINFVKLQCSCLICRGWSESACGPTVCHVGWFESFCFLCVFSLSSSPTRLCGAQCLCGVCVCNLRGNNLAVNITVSNACCCFFNQADCFHLCACFVSLLLFFFGGCASFIHAVTCYMRNQRAVHVSAATARYSRT